MRELSREALASAPHATEWAQPFANRSTSSRGCVPPSRGPDGGARLRRGIAEACISNVDEMLHHLLATAIDDCKLWWAGQPLARGRSEDDDWAALRRLTGANAGADDSADRLTPVAAAVSAFASEVGR